MWTHFKTFFAEEHHDLKEQQDVNTSHGKFHPANIVADISTALVNLATAATSNCCILAHLANSNKALAETKKLLTEHTSLEANTLLIENLTPSNSQQHKSEREANQSLTYRDGWPTWIAPDIVGRMDIMSKMDTQTSIVNLEETKIISSLG
jgi:hypothetical protein